MFDRTQDSYISVNQNAKPSLISPDEQSSAEVLRDNVIKSQSERRTISKKAEKCRQVTTGPDITGKSSSACTLRTGMGNTGVCTVAGKSRRRRCRWTMLSLWARYDATLSCEHV